MVNFTIPDNPRTSPSSRIRCGGGGGGGGANCSRAVLSLEIGVGQTSRITRQ